jgi:hypoxanthine phosphoribosyltransferase
VLLRTRIRGLIQNVLISKRANTMADNKKYILYTDIHKLVSSTAAKVKEFNPDFMVAIGGGGFIPARILRTFIKIPILAVGIKLYDDTTNTAKEPEKIQWLDDKNVELVKGKRVLIVDEVDDTRLTLQYCVDELQKHDVAIENIGVLVIHNKKKQKRGVLSPKVHYFAAQDIEDAWVVYPWDAIDIEEHESIALKQRSSSN